MCFVQYYAHADDDITDKYQVKQRKQYNLLTTVISLLFSPTLHVVISFNKIIMLKKSICIKCDVHNMEEVRQGVLGCATAYTPMYFKRSYEIRVVVYRKGIRMAACRYIVFDTFK